MGDWCAYVNVVWGESRNWSLHCQGQQLTINQLSNFTFSLEVDCAISI